MAITFFPREHGAYGQVTFPLLTALAVAGLSWSGVLLGVAVVAGFLAHEAASVLLGQRGPRARRELGRDAVRWLAWCLLVAAVAGAAALALFTAGSRGWVLVPLVPALVLTVATVTGREKSAAGEVAAALAFSGMAVPVSIAGGEGWRTAIAVAVPFAVLFIASTLAVRVVILRVRGGGDPRAADHTRLAAFLVAAAAIAGLYWAARVDLLPGAALAAAAPGLAVAVVVAATPPPPSRLRTLGWTLMAASVLTAAITVVGVP